MGGCGLGRSGEQGSEDGGRHGGDARRMGRVERDGLGSHSRERREDGGRWIVFCARGPML